jgi:hypothetical protein
MRTTLRLDDDLLAQTKKLALETGRTFTEVVEHSLRMTLARRRETQSKKPIKLHTCGGKGLQPGVDLRTNATLEDLMDDHDGFTGR